MKKIYKKKKNLCFIGKIKNKKVGQVENEEGNNNNKFYFMKDIKKEVDDEV